MPDENYAVEQAYETQPEVAAEPVVDPLNEPVTDPEINHMNQPSPSQDAADDAIEAAAPVAEATAQQHKIREAIRLLDGHSASRIAGSSINDAIILLEEAYAL